MKLSFPISALFGSKTTENSSSEMEKILIHTINLIVRQDLVIDLIEKFNKIKASNDSLKTQNYIQIYLTLEDFIVKNKPLVIKQEYTKESLHEEIRKSSNLDLLPDEFKLIFLPEKEQLFTLFCIYTKVLTDYITEQMGKNEVSNSLSQIFPGTFFTGFSTTDGQLISIIHQKITSITAEQLTETFKQINSVLYKHIADSFGENTALELTDKNYKVIKELYGYYLIAQYLKAVPDGILDRERVTFMTREELEKQAMTATKEEQLRREMAEKLASNLRQENSIIEQKVHQQTAEIIKEKEALKKAIETININYLKAEQNEAKLLASVKSLSLGFILTDTNNNVVIHNEAAKKILRISDDPNSINPISIKLKNSRSIFENIEKTRRENVPVIFEETTIHDQTLNITITPVSLSEPKTEYIGSAILIDDITEVKRLERTKDEFFAIASHELRTPLTSIRGSVSLLKEHYKNNIENGEMSQLVEVIDKSSTHLIGIVNQFLDVSLLELGRIIFNYKNFDIRDLARNVVKEFDHAAQSKNLTLKIEESEGEFNVYADIDKTKQIFEILISNGIKFTENGGITVSFEARDNHILTRVEDTGIGIKKENQNSLFQKFRQADDILTHDASRGTGLGLYIGRKLIENMNGSIYLERSIEGVGSSLVFSLPSTKLS